MLGGVGPLQLRGVVGPGLEQLVGPARGDPAVEPGLAEAGSLPAQEAPHAGAVVRVLGQGLVVLDVPREKRVVERTLVLGLALPHVQHRVHLHVHQVRQLPFQLP